LSEKLLMF